MSQQRGGKRVRKGVCVSQKQREGAGAKEELPAGARAVQATKRQCLEDPQDTHPEFPGMDHRDGNRECCVPGLG